MFTLDEVISATGAMVCESLVAKGLNFTGISTDSRTVKEGELFIALKGEKFDGHEYIAQVIKKGIQAVIVNEGSIAEKQNRENCLIVSDTLQALLQLAKFHRMRFKYPVIAITGSNGKTTTKEMLAAILGSKFCVHKSKANHNNEIGVAQTLLGMNEKYDITIIEMGMRGAGEIKLLTETAKPTMGIITNIGDTHIERLGSVENIAKAKGELAAGLSDKDFLLTNCDDGWHSFLRKRTKATVRTFGFSAHCHARVVKMISSDIFSSEVRVDCLGKIFDLRIPAAGRHNVYNALAAALAAVYHGLEAKDIIEGMQNFNNAEMRFSISDTKAGVTLINDAYNASPLSMKAGIETLTSVSDKRRIAVLGDMLELGSHAKDAHKNVIALACKSGMSALFILGEEMKVAFAEMSSEKETKIIFASSHEELGRLLDEYLLPGDVVLLKGSRGMYMEKVLTYCNKLK